MAYLSIIRFELVAIFAFIGLALSAWIFVTKIRRKKLICVTRDECMSVVTGRYSMLFGVPNELWGMGYHALVLAYAAGGLSQPSLVTADIEITIRILATIGTLFAMRLVYIQVFVIKKLCEWCLAISLVSAMMYWLITLP